jgi:hypothetical protein
MVITGYTAEFGDLPPDFYQNALIFLYNYAGYWVARKIGGFPESE